MFENLVPTITKGGHGGILKLHPRNGRTVSLPTVNSKTARSIQRIRDSSLMVHGANLFNHLPKTIRNYTNCSHVQFKAVLDQFLSGIPDEPLVAGYTQNRPTKSNSLVSLGSALSATI